MTQYFGSELGIRNAGEYLCPLWFRKWTKRKTNVNILMWHLFILRNIKPFVWFGWIVYCVVVLVHLVAKSWKNFSVNTPTKSCTNGQIIKKNCIYLPWTKSSIVKTSFCSHAFTIHITEKIHWFRLVTKSKNVFHFVLNTYINVCQIDSIFAQYTLRILTRLITD